MALKRREFLRTAIGGAAAVTGFPTIIPSSALGADGAADLGAAGAEDVEAAAGREACVAAEDVESALDPEACVAGDGAVAPVVGATLHPVSDSAPKLSAIASLWRRGVFGCACLNGDFINGVFWNNGPLRAL